MKAIIERHGGTVEKFIGDAVMAVFGVPQVHEDDALRACRAAVEMRDALPELGVQARIGVNTGEVVTGTEERLATGDAVNVAARLEQAAQPGEILIGEDGAPLVRNAVETEAVEPLALKGKSEPVAAFRLLAVHEPTGRRAEAPMVGRERELDRLAGRVRRAGENRSCQLFTILGAAGVGKSRLAREFLADLDARIVVGRCLSYGEGITYWPVVEVVKQLRRAPLRRGGSGSAPLAAGRKRRGNDGGGNRLGLPQAAGGAGAARPLVCVLDDIHWGEETFLDLVEHVADLSRDAPILLLCMARPELLDAPGLGRREAERDHRPARAALARRDRDPDRRARRRSRGAAARIRDAAEGNPLFVEEMLAMLRESTAARSPFRPRSRRYWRRGWTGSSRTSGACSSVFRRGPGLPPGAVAALAPDEAEPRAARRAGPQGARPTRPNAAAGDDAFRFRHLLIRDAAYDALPRRPRRVARALRRWLDERGPIWSSWTRSSATTWSRRLATTPSSAARMQSWPSAPASGWPRPAGGRYGAGTCERPASCSGERSS